MKIAMAGKIRSGKDQFAKYFIDRGFKRFAFADGIGEIIKTYFPEEWAKGKPRHLYQAIGQYLRQIDPYIWIKYTAKKMDAYLKENSRGHIIITDSRQANEFDWLKSNGFIVIKVESKEEVRIKRMLAMGDLFNQETLYHETEKQADKIVGDYLVINNGTLNELMEKSEAIYETLMQGGL